MMERALTPDTTTSATIAIDTSIAKPLTIVLLSPYELGRQPFSLAHPAACLSDLGHDVRCLDLAVQSFDDALLSDADLVAINIPMFTAMRLVTELLPQIQTACPEAVLATYGLYSMVNAQTLQAAGVQHVLAGEFESNLLAIAQGISCDEPLAPVQQIDNPKIDFMVPQRTGLPALSEYAHLITVEGTRRVTGFVESTRGCKYLCRHCPVVPVYQGRFRAIPADIVMADIDQQVAQGAEHISFGDPDFFNGATHAMRVLERMHTQYPALTFDATIKIEHLVNHDDKLATLKAYGCLFLTTAVESVDDAVLEHLDKGHTRADFEQVAHRLQEVGIAMAPTFVPFLPWTSIESYIEMLRTIAQLDLVNAVSPVQLSIRLLIPQGSYLLQLPGFTDMIDDFDGDMLGYPWTHSDSRVDGLQEIVQQWVQDGDSDGLSRPEIFLGVWQRAHASLGVDVPPLNVSAASAVPSLSEQWYCCAEPTAEQMNAARRCSTSS